MQKGDTPCGMFPFCITGVAGRIGTAEGDSSEHDVFVRQMRAAPKCSARICDKTVRCVSVIGRAEHRKEALSGNLQLFHDPRHTENVDCPPQIAGQHMQTHPGPGPIVNSQSSSCALAFNVAISSKTRAGTQFDRICLYLPAIRKNNCHLSGMFSCQFHAPLIR